MRSFPKFTGCLLLACLIFGAGCSDPKKDNTPNPEFVIPTGKGGGRSKELIDPKIKPANGS